MKLLQVSLCLCAAFFLGACAKAVIAPVGREHPASTKAPESSTRPLRPMLGADAATQRTRELLAKRAAQQEAAESEAPGNETNIVPKTKTPSGQ
jgi:hypothetical protein